MSNEANGDGKGLMPSAFLVGAVLLIMVAGMLLQTDPAPVLPRGGGAGSPALALPLGSAVTPERAPADPVVAAIQTAPAPTSDPPNDPPVEPTIVPKAKREPAAAPPPLDPLLVKLAARAEGDSGRIAKSRGRWTAQLLVACKPETVDRLLGVAAGSPELYVLPAQIKDDACFRVCFGSYATPKDAALASDLPKALRGKDKIGAVEIAKVIP